MATATALQSYLNSLEDRPETRGQVRQGGSDLFNGWYDVMRLGDAAWHAARNTMITMSDTAAFGGFHPNKTTYEALRSKLCISSEPKESMVTQRGHDMEPVVRQEYARLMADLHPMDEVEVEEVSRFHFSTTLPFIMMIVCHADQHLNRSHLSDIRNTIFLADPLMEF